MQYLSPSAFFGETLSAPLDKKAIQLGRKKLFAELELNGGSTIELHGKQLTRNDIIQYFESLLKEDALSYHSAVGEDPVLLRFLEYAVIGRQELFLKNPLYDDEQFVHWISPCFKHAFLAFMTNCFLVEPDEDGLVSLLVNNHMMTPGDLEQAWETVIKILMDDISTLEQFHAKGSSAGDPSQSNIGYLMEFRYIRLIQVLPQSLFASIRDKYALGIMKASIVAFNNNNQFHNTVRTWLENAELLAVSEAVKTSINNKIRELDAIKAPAEEKKKDFSVLKLMVVAVIMIIRLATCKSNSSSHSYYNTMPAVSPHEIQWNREHLLDSLKSRYPDKDWEKIAHPADSVPTFKEILDSFNHKIKPSKPGIPAGR